MRFLDSVLLHTHSLELLLNYQCSWLAELAIFFIHLLKKGEAEQVLLFKYHY